MARFVRYELRTTEVPAARAFYAAVLGHAPPEVVPLPAEAAARGAPAHWLGHLGVDDVDGAARAFVDRGATRLGPTRRTDRGQVALVRDPGGAVVALATPSTSRAGIDVAWHQLCTGDLVRATTSYAALFGWGLTGDLDLGSLGVHRRFAWEEGGVSVGAFFDAAQLPGAHPHWLFHLRVDDLEVALSAIAAGGGRVVGPTVAVGEVRVAMCEDPQGAAFALRAASVD